MYLPKVLILLKLPFPPTPANDLHSLNDINLYISSSQPLIATKPSSREWMSVVVFFLFMTCFASQYVFQLCACLSKSYCIIQRLWNIYSYLACWPLKMGNHKRYKMWFPNEITVVYLLRLAQPTVLEKQTYIKSIWNRFTLLSENYRQISFLDKYIIYQTYILPLKGPL